MTRQRVRVVLCTSGGICGSLVLDRLLASGRIEVIGVVESSRILRRHYSWFRGALQQIRISGFRYAFYLWCSTAGADALGYPFSPFRSVAMQAARHRIPRLATRDLNDAAGRTFLEALKPDLLVSAFFNQRIDESICAIACAGGINIHPSLLPEYKGVDPVFFARLREVRECGVTIHRLSFDFDCGDIICQEKMAVRQEQSILAITAALYFRGACLLSSHIDRIMEGASGIPQASAGCYDSWPSPAQVRTLRSRGIPLLRFSDFGAMADLLLRDNHGG